MDAVRIYDGCILQCNNCLRAVRTWAFPTRHGSADCSSYFLATVTEYTTLSTLTISGTLTSTPVNILSATHSTALPAYATPCKAEGAFSSACSCIGVTHSTTTIIPSATTSSSVTKSINTNDGYVIVSPTSCPSITVPTGMPIAQSDKSFSDTHGGLQYQQFPGKQYVLNNGSNTPFYADFSDPSKLIISDGQGYTLILFANGTFDAFAGNCELEIVCKWQAKAPSARRSSTPRDLSLAPRDVSSVLCNDVQFFCNTGFGVGLSSFGAGFACASIGVELGEAIGGGIGFLGNLLGPEVGIPTTLAGVVLGGQLGGFIAGRIGQSLCAAATGELVYKLCGACPPTNCGPGTISCNGGPCQDALSDPNNCGKCGNVCPSGVCRNAQCSNPVCNGSTCGSLNSCGGSCFCFATADGTGFCGPSESCAPLTDCSSNADCAQGLICATGTCCQRNVCIQACGVALKRRDPLLLARGNATELFTDGLKNVF